MCSWLGRQKKAPRVSFDFWAKCRDRKKREIWESWERIREDRGHQGQVTGRLPKAPRGCLMNMMWLDVS